MKEENLSKVLISDAKQFYNAVFSYEIGYSRFEFHLNSFYHECAALLKAIVANVEKSKFDDISEVFYFNHNILYIYQIYIKACLILQIDPLDIYRLQFNELLKYNIDLLFNPINEFLIDMSDSRDQCSRGIKSIRMAFKKMYTDIFNACKVNTCFALSVYLKLFPKKYHVLKLSRNNVARLNLLANKSELSMLDVSTFNSIISTSFTISDVKNIEQIALCILQEFIVSRDIERMSIENLNRFGLFTINSHSEHYNIFVNISGKPSALQVRLFYMAIIKLALDQYVEEHIPTLKELLDIRLNDDKDCNIFGNGNEVFRIQSLILSLLKFNVYFPNRYRQNRHLFT